MRFAILAASALVLSTVAVAAAAGPTVTVGQETATSSAYLRYFPETVVVYEGDTVTWASGGHTPHTVTQFPPGPGAFDSTPAMQPDDEELGAWFGPGGFLMPSQTFSMMFDEAGEYAYICKIHPGMVGKVTVTEPELEGGELPDTDEPDTVHVSVGQGSGDTTIDRYWPAEITVAAGSTVVWTNTHDAEPHTVTSETFDSSPSVAGEPEWWGGADGLMMDGGENKQFAVTFDDAGTFSYGCKLHPGMWGTVIVLEKQEAASVAPPTDGGTPPPSSTPAFLTLFALTAIGFAAVAFRRFRAA